MSSHKHTQDTQRVLSWGSYTNTQAKTPKRCAHWVHISVALIQLGLVDQDHAVEGNPTYLRTVFVKLLIFGLPRFRAYLCIDLPGEFVDDLGGRRSSRVCCSKTLEAPSPTSKVASTPSLSPNAERNYGFLSER